jgi:Flp pilus assembly protein TadG
MAEAAIVLPISVMVILGMVYGGLSVYRYQQCAEVAREGARWASVHGAQYHTDTGKAIATPTTVYNTGMKHAAVSFDKTHVALSGAGCTTDPFQFSITWSDPAQGRGSTVTVMVKYKMFSGAYVTSTSKMPVVY